MPPFHPLCRCTDVPYYDDMLEEGGTRTARDANGEYISVPEDMTYPEWKKVIDEGGDFTSWKKPERLKILEKPVAKVAKTDMIEESGTKEATDVHTIGRIDREIYKCVTKDIVTDEVIITDNQIQHIKERHPNDYERFSKYFAEIVASPDYIIESLKPSTALVLKEIELDGEMFKTVLRLVTSEDNPEYKNSIITFMKIDEKEWMRLLRNKNILYRRE